MRARAADVLRAMASVGHLVVGWAAAEAAGSEDATTRQRWTAVGGFVALSFLPDLDVIAFRLGVPYGAPFGHRGASHSLAVAAFAGLVAALMATLAKREALRLGLLVTLVMASHGLLDALTDGGMGIGLLWPVDDTRYFAPWRPLPVAPIGRAFLSPRGLGVAAVELLWFVPLIAWTLWRRSRRRPRAT
jgi:inner membrane protein